MIHSENTDDRLIIFQSIIQFTFIDEKLSGEAIETFINLTVSANGYAGGSWISNCSSY